MCREEWPWMTGSTRLYTGQMMKVALTESLCDWGPVQWTSWNYCSLFHFIHDWLFFSWNYQRVCPDYIYIYMYIYNTIKRLIEYYLIATSNVKAIKCAVILNQWISSRFIYLYLLYLLNLLIISHCYYIKTRVQNCYVEQNSSIIWGTSL